MKKCCNFSFLLLLVIFVFTFLFKKDIVKKFFPKKQLFISKVVSKEDQKIIKLLNKALADEWLAYYQYWSGAKVAKGEYSKEVIKELEEHAKEEREHADMLAEQILKLGGVPILDFEDIQELTSCGYLVPPATGDLKIILKQNIESEGCAIRIYTKLLTMINKNNEKLKNVLTKILQDEKDHEKELLELFNR